MKKGQTPLNKPIQPQNVSGFDPPGEVGGGGGLFLGLFPRFGGCFVGFSLVVLVFSVFFLVVDPLLIGFRGVFQLFGNLSDKKRPNSPGC